MTTPFQVVIDAADPHMVNRFWSAAMGYEMEDHHDFIKQLLDSGAVTDDDVVEIDGRLAFKSGAASRDPAGVAPRLLFQLVPEQKSVKNRVHLDLHVGDERRESEVERLIGLGASRLWDGQQGPNRWVTMADPEGNEFCVA
jgi:Glyoxalase-like domain